jgi:hypothetical protein
LICIFLATSSAKKTSEKQDLKIPTVQKIAHEYLVQNTVKFAKANAIYQTDIDKNPTKYHIMNGLSAAEDKAAAPTLYTQDKTPYYDPTKPQAVAATKIPYQGTALNRYTNQLYPLDTVPYYGPSQPFRPIVNGAGDHFSIPASIENLEERVASQKNIIELKKQLDRLNDWFEGPKYMTHDTKGREVYSKDAKAYYDPTALDKQTQRVKLQNQIREMTIEMNTERPTLIVGTKKVNVSIQNFVNTNKEETNEFIGKSYYYPVDRSTLANSTDSSTVNRMDGNLKKEEKVNKNQAINIYTRKPENIRIGSTNKYYDDNMKSGVVEAESTGVTADKAFYYEDKKITTTTNEVQNKAPNTQGMKTAGFRILRKGN